MITPDDLRGLKPFVGSSEESLAFFAKNSADVAKLSGDWILHEGERPRFFVILAGSADVVKNIAGLSQTIDRYVIGDSFGEVPLMLSASALAGIRANSPVRLARVDPATFWQMMHREESFRSVVLANISRRITLVEHLISETPPERCTLRGDSHLADSHELRDFLTRMHIAYDWEERSGDACEVSFTGGPTFVAPTIQRLAEHLKLVEVERSEHYDVAIVGAGPAGLAAAVYGASEGFETLLIERYAPGGQAGMSSLIENYLGFPSGVSGEDLADRAFHQARRFGAHVVVTRGARSLKGGPRDRRLTLDDGQTVLAKTVVLATGVSYRELVADNCAGFLNCGIYYGAAQTEALGMNGRQIHIVGGGNSAGQAALNFADYARSVKIVIRADELSKDMSQYLIDQVVRRKNISVVPGCEIVAVDGAGRLERIALRSTRDGATGWEACDGLFVFIGADPNTDWLDGFVVCDERGYIITGPEASATRGGWPLTRDPYFLETNQPGIFAVGDVRKGSVKRVAAGVGEGSSAISLVSAYLRDQAR
ncbi:MAG: FAD-dependent oxidoreductase [Candidatus Eremiobacteraeota bacterium]|nr:FAD-dependent oxidoreductase [Candidatus Eremiobacteraeota bacterium]